MKINKLSKNFDFIENDEFKSSWKEDIIESISFAERFNDNAASCNKIRVALEYLLNTFVNKVYSSNEDRIKHFINTKDLKGKIDLLKNYNITSERNFFNCLHSIRVVGNNASHANCGDFIDNISKLEVVASLKNLYSIIYNLFIKELDQNKKYEWDENVYYQDIRRKEEIDKIIAIKDFNIQNEYSFNSDLIIQQNNIFSWFTIQKAILKIPIYQRGYEWSLENIEVLFNDIKKRLDDHKSHYFGTIAQKKEASKKNHDKDVIKIIDGQQRLTTSVLFICAARDILINKFNVNINSIPWYNEIVNKIGCLFEYIHNPGGTNDNNISFRNIISSTIDINKKLNQKCDTSFFINYKHIYKLIDDDISLKTSYDVNSFIENFLQNFVVASINFESYKYPSSSEMEIFESLNSKGKSLEIIDLIKNFIFTLIDDNYLNSNEHNIACQYNAILSEYNIFDKNDKILSFYLTLSELFSGNEIESKKNSRFEIIKNALINFLNIDLNKKIDSEQKVKKLFENLGCYIKCYVDIVDGDSEILKLFNSIKFINYITIPKKKMLFIYFAYILKIIIQERYEKNNQKQFDYKLKNMKIESINLEKKEIRAIQEFFLELAKFVIRTQVISGQGDSRIKRIVIKIANTLYNERNSFDNLKDFSELGIKLIHNNLDEKYPLNDFINKLKNNSSHNTITSLLLMTEDYLSNGIFNVGESIKRPKVTLEHIMPLNPIKWEKEINESDLDSFKQKHNEYKEKIGNYLILTDINNSKGKNHVFSYKKENIYSKLISKLYNNENSKIDISNCNVWTFEKIDERTEALIDYIIKNVINK